ncbi:MAG: hypothetical protein GC179_17075 [Anaerolineaceae bacterium]|nr:hypothetical protein [Anaerolineaceae bacterium]
MMRRLFSITLGVLIMASGIAWMQSPTPTLQANAAETITVTAMTLGAVTTATPTPFPTKTEDPRPAICAAPYQENWQPYVVKAGDTLPALLQNIRDLSVTQAAALNCVDDPMALPVGSVIWLPSASSNSDANKSACQQLVQSLDCAVQSVGIVGAQQLFQNGMMLWREDTREIWVIVNDSTQLQVFEDTYTEGEADPTASPPNTFFVPKRGFGKVWAELGGQNSVLGWATAPESQISLTVQPAGRVSYTTYVQTPDGSIYAATVLPHQVNGWWVKIGTT